MKNILFLLLLCATNAFAQSDRLLTPEQMKADLDYYFETLYICHPNPYYYYSLNELEKQKTDIYSQLSKPLTHEQFAWIIGEMNSYLDAHSRIYIYHQTHWRKQITYNDKIFPVVKIEKNKVYLKECNAEINEINGVRTDEIISDFKKYFNWKLPYERNIHWMEEFFYAFLMNKYNIRAPFRVKLDNSVEIQVLNGYSPYKLNQDFSVGLSRQAKNSFKIYPFSSIAIFNLSDFQESRKEALERELDLFFKRVNSMNIRNIFYDLSMNQGGDFDTFYSAVKALNIVKHGTITFSIDKTERVGLVNRKYRLDEKVLQPNTTNIQIPEGRKLFVIQGINTMSVGDYFCRIVAANKLGTLVGQNSGEPTVAFSCSFYHTMSNSKISFSIATALLDFSDYFKHETLHPDVYWDVNNSRKFSEEELNDIIKHCMK